MPNNEITISNKVATFIKEKRFVLGMNQREFAIHVFNDARKKDWICRIENGRGISLKTVDRIFTAVDADISIIEY